MKKMFLRVLAFAFDMFFVSAIVYGLSNISFLNPNKGEITQYYQELEEIKNEYDDIRSRWASSIPVGNYPNDRCRCELSAKWDICRSAIKR